MTQEKKKASKKPKGKVFDAYKWFGSMPELAGDTLEIQRKMRGEWDREWDREEKPPPIAPVP
jgi:hypothetical protein